MKTVSLTFDVEDWFQVENLRRRFPPEEWRKCEVRVDKNVKIILELLDKYKVKATFFVLGWIAERFPELVREIYNRGHEIASHGYGHTINSKLSYNDLKYDVKKSKEILEKIIGEKIQGYRAPNFSITEDLIEILYEVGFIYDSSYHPFSKHKSYGRINSFEKINSGIIEYSNGLKELPIPVLRKGNLEIPFAGGGYFRLYPYIVFKYLFESFMKNNAFFILYLHPWEFDLMHPKVDNVKISNKIRHFIGISTTKNKLEKFIKHILSNNFEVKPLLRLVG